MNYNFEQKLPEYVQEFLGIEISNFESRFDSEGWRYQGRPEIACSECENDYYVFRKKYSTSQSDYEYWALICSKCNTCEGLDVMNSETKAIFRNWSDQIENYRSAQQELKVNKKLSHFGNQSDLKPTDEQDLIILSAQGNSDLSIEALAGTGKTTTLKLLAESKKNQKGTYVAFNRSIVDEAKLRFPSNVSCSTAHGLAYKAIGRHFQSRLNSNQRLSMKQIADWLDAPSFVFKSKISNHQLDPIQLARYAQITVRNFCKSIDSDISEIHIESPVLISANEENSKRFAKVLMPLAEKIWADLKLQDGFMRFSHDNYLKMWQLTSPTISSDFILFDEAQDADPVMLDVINSQQNAQLVYCGDQFQAIYEWRGAKNALKLVNVDKHLWLTQSFRFGSEIADYANYYLKKLSAPKLIKGYSSIESRLTKVNNPDAILCRTNAGVVSALMSEQSRGRKTAIIGRTQEMIDFAEACRQLKSGNRTGHPELAPFLTWEDLLGFIEEYPEEAQEIKTMVELIQSFTPEKLISSLNSTVEEKIADVVISTAHRAKGREWDQVKLHGDFLHKDDMDLEDLRLSYVAVTRAKLKLDISAWEEIEKLPTRKSENQANSSPTRKRPPLIINANDNNEKSSGLISRLRNPFG